MIKRFLLLLAVFLTAPMFAQEGNSSPYSYYGIGLRNFKGTVENQSMGGISILGDSIHVNLQNPAGFGALRLTNFTLGGSRKDVSLKSDAGTGTNTSTNLDYVTLGFPIAKNMGAGFGLIPYTSVEYKITNRTDEFYERFMGRGGLNKAFVSWGYEFYKGIRIGATASYNFGNIRRESVREDRGQQLGIQEINRSDISGVSFNLGLQAERKITEKLNLYGSAMYTPESTISAENNREISTVGTAVQTLPTQRVKTDFKLPSEYTLGLGIGESSKWFTGVEYTSVQTSQFTNPSYSLQNVSYDDDSQFRIGGFYIPRFNSITSYWERMVYRAGFRYQETGLNINGVGINEFGISFGIGLPMGRAFSNANISFEYGQRGTENASLVKEDFFKVGLSLSLNDKWFVPFKFN
ncbi:hypothetical protein [Flavimarina sp. Hel_I_48]|uniref:hypothetical protein n=1 Tax=Flavimarina sp. Hel_I_48 TaxID=1392488 RepID=UPI0004DFA9A0|nr:hypothetical protein [Flavimarina sp. Hel_I_48]